MCNPAALVVASVVISAAATGYSFYAQDQQVDAQNEYTSSRAKEGAALARKDWELKIQAEQERQQQESEEAALATQQTQKDAAKARSDAVVSAGEANVGGFAIQALLDDFSMQEAAQAEIIKRNREFGLSQSNLRRIGYGAEARGRIASTTGQMQARPSYIGLGLQLAGNGISQYNQYRT